MCLALTYPGPRRNNKSSWIDSWQAGNERNRPFPTLLAEMQAGFSILPERHEYERVSILAYYNNLASHFSIGKIPTESNGWTSASRTKQPCFMMLLAFRPVSRTAETAVCKTAVAGANPARDSRFRFAGYGGQAIFKSGARR